MPSLYGSSNVTSVNFVLNIKNSHSTPSKFSADAFASNRSMCKYPLSWIARNFRNCDIAKKVRKVCQNFENYKHFREQSQMYRCGGFVGKRQWEGDRRLAKASGNKSHDIRQQSPLLHRQLGHNSIASLFIHFFEFWRIQTD